MLKRWLAVPVFGKEKPLTMACPVGLMQAMVTPQPERSPAGAYFPLLPSETGLGLVCDTGPRLHGPVSQPAGRPRATGDNATAEQEATTMAFQDRSAAICAHAGPRP